MCGICGKIMKDPGAPIPSGLIEAMTNRLAHRGPDGSGFFNDKGAALGHRRLSIIDLAKSNQPLHNEDHNLIFIGNGEIYNFRELRENLLRQGHVFYTDGDMETLIHLYEQYGENCLRDVRGMFAFAIWDKIKRTLFVARDRLGKKPLYYCAAGDFFSFASEAKALLADPAVTVEIEPSAAALYLKYGYVPEGHCIYKGLGKLPPAHYGIWRDGKFRAEKYWEARPSEGAPPSPEELRAAVKEAVRIRLVSDVPLGVFLSGGIDSSIVALCAAECLNEPLRTFSVGFPEKEYNELEYARLLANKIQSQHTEEMLTPEAIEGAENLAKFYDEPFADSSALPTFYLSQATVRHVKVALNGDGGDEVFGGYERYRAMRMAERIAGLPKALKSAAGALGNFISPSEDLKGFRTRLSKFLRGLKLDTARRYETWQSLAVDDILLKAAGPMLKNPLTETIAEGYVEKIIRSATNQVDAAETACRADLVSYLPGDLLVKADRASMACGLECRSPLLDHKLIELALRIPFGEHIQGRQLKAALKKAFEKDLPPEILNRRKMGFGVPVSRWFRSDEKMKSFLKDTLFDRSCLSRGVFDPKGIFELAGRHLRGEADHGALLWAALMFELWAKEYLDRPRSVINPSSRKTVQQ